MGFLAFVKEIDAYFNRDKYILRQAKKENGVIYGSYALKKQIGFIGRKPSDFDIYTKKPQRSAAILRNKLNQKSGAELYYTKPSKHQGTYKVKYVGADHKKGTSDDVKVADYSKLSKPMRTVRIDGIRYAHISNIEKDKMRAIKNIEKKDRWQKDIGDLDRIKAWRLTR